MSSKRGLEKYDKDGDGTLDETELRQAYYDGEMKNFKDLFEACDEDSSGFLDRTEMGAFFKLIGKSHSDTRKLFRETDTNGDGKISYSEFNDWLKKEVIEQTFDVGHCEQTIGNASREMESKTSQHLKMVAKVNADKAIIAQLNADAKPYREKREALRIKMIERKKRAEELRKKLDMLSKSMHDTAALMKQIKPGGRHVSGIALLQIGHESHTTNTGRGRGRVPRHRSAMQKSASTGFILGAKSSIDMASSRPISAQRGHMKSLPGLAISKSLPKGMSETK